MTSKSICIRCHMNIAINSLVCPQCIQKGVEKEMKGRMPRIPPDENTRYGTDQDKTLFVTRERTTTGQRYFLITTPTGTLRLSLRSCIDLVHKLQKQMVDEYTDMMLMFMKGKDE